MVPQSGNRGVLSPTRRRFAIKDRLTRRRESLSPTRRRFAIKVRANHSVMDLSPTRRRFAIKSLLKRLVRTPVAYM